MKILARVSRQSAANVSRWNVATKVAVLTIALAMTFAKPSYASETVTFETPPVQQSAFKIKRAEAQGKTLEPTPGISLSGVLSQPEGAGPHPAVVILPESVEARPSYEEWAGYLTANGYVTLIVESLVSRDETFLRDDLPMNLLVDAQGSLAFLSSLENVDPKRISLFGIGMSGWYVQRSLDVNFTRGAKDLSFNAGVAIYPHCNPDMELLAPILVLAGEEDNRISMAACQALVGLNKQKHAQTELKIYTGATHYFDNAAYSKIPDLRPAGWKEPKLFDQNTYSPVLRAQAEKDVLDFINSAAASD